MGVKSRAITKKKTFCIFGLCLEFVFSSPEQAKFKGQLNPKFQSYFVFPNSACSDVSVCQD